MSAASRWAKGVIEDFTLIIDVGEFQQFVIANSFFKSGDEWQVDGMTKQTLFDESFPKEEQEEATQFYVQKSPIIFKKKNFKIGGELYLVSHRYYKKFRPYTEHFDYDSNDLPFNLSDLDLNQWLPNSRLSYKIYKNFPYARQGCVFKDKKMQKYFERLDWYQKDPSYKISPKLLSKREKELYEVLDELSLKMLKNLPYAKQGYVFKTDQLQLYFQNQHWYKKNPKYQATISTLSQKEQAWLKKIKALEPKDIKNMYHFVDEYNAIYDNCLHKHEKDKVHDFMRRLTLMDKQQIKARFSKKDSKRIDKYLIDDLKTELTEETLEQYINNFSDKYDTYSIELYEDENNKGCYEYFFTHGHESPEDSTGEYGFFIGIGKENGAFKIVRLSLAG